MSLNELRRSRQRETHPPQMWISLIDLDDVALHDRVVKKHNGDGEEVVSPGRHEEPSGGSLTAQSGKETRGAI